MDSKDTKNKLDYHCKCNDKLLLICNATDKLFMTVGVLIAVNKHNVVIVDCNDSKRRYVIDNKNINCVMPNHYDSIIDADAIMWCNQQPQLQSQLQPVMDIKTKIDSIINAIVTLDNKLVNTIKAVDAIGKDDLKDIADSNTLYLFGIYDAVLLAIMYGSLLVIDITKVDIDAVQKADSIMHLDDVLDDAVLIKIASI